MKRLTSRTVIERVVVDLVTGTPETDAEAVTNILYCVVINLSVHRLHNGNPGVLHVVNVVVYAAPGKKKPTKNNSIS